MKKWYQSKTILFNIATGIVAIADQYEGIIPAKFKGILTGAAVIANLFLRTISSGTISK